MKRKLTWLEDSMKVAVIEDEKKSQQWKMKMKYTKKYTNEC